MDSKEEKELNSTLLIVNEDFDKIEDFDDKNYQNRKYNSSNFEEGKKFFKLRYVKNKLNNIYNNKTNIINIEKKNNNTIRYKRKRKIRLV